MEKQSIAKSDKIPLAMGEQPNETDDKKAVGKQGGRKRVSQACDTCRTRKDRCSGERPVCSTCKQHARICAYEANVKKRGLPEGYVWGIEKLWGLTIREVDGAEKRILELLNGHRQDSRLRELWNDDRENLAEVWRQSTLSKELERLLPELEAGPEPRKRKLADSKGKPSKKPRKGSSPQENGYDDQASLTSTQGYGSRLSNGFQNDWDGYSNASPTKNSEATLKPSQSQASLSGTVSAYSPEYVKLPSETWHLLDVWFSYTHIWFPITEKHNLLRTSYQYSQSRGTMNTGKGDQAALWAVIAYAKCQHRQINSIPHAKGPVREHVWTAERIYSHARSLIPDDNSLLDTGHVQALLVLSLVKMGLGQFGNAASLIAQAVRLALDLGLQRDARDLMISSPPSKIKHIFLGCFVLDTIIAARLGHRPNLRSEDVDQITINEDGSEEWDPWSDSLNIRKVDLGDSRAPATTLSTFNKLVQVLQILNEATSMTSELNQNPERTTNLLEKLGLWSQVQMNNNKASLLFPHHFHLHLAYLTTLSTLQMKSNFDSYLRSARQIVDLITQQSLAFGLLIIPPTFEYYVKATYDATLLCERSTQIGLGDVKHGLNSCLISMEPGWPVFESLRKSTGYGYTLGSRQGPELAVNTINANPRAADARLSIPAPKSSSTYDFPATSPYTPQSARSYMADSIIPIQETTPPTSASNRDFNQMLTPSFQPSNRKRPQIPFTTNSQNQDYSLSYTPIDLPPRTQLQQTQNPAPLSSEVDTDSTFNEFAALDAMQWTDNWDQSLVNLGFTDPDSMNQDFYAFCRDPDPLYPNGALQQLLANSNNKNGSVNEAAAGILDGGFAGASDTAGMLGGFGGPNLGFGRGVRIGRGGEEIEGIEAGQILQALSAGRDNRAMQGVGGER